MIKKETTTYLRNLLEAHGLYESKDLTNPRINYQLTTDDRLVVNVREEFPGSPMEKYLIDTLFQAVTKNTTFKAVLSEPHDCMVTRPVKTLCFVIRY